MTIRTAVMMGLLLLLVGCGKLTLDNYNKITVGMHYEEVTDLLGSPTSCDDLMGVRSCQWGDADQSVTVNFVAGKVLLFSSSNLK